MSNYHKNQSLTKGKLSNFKYLKKYFYKYKIMFFGLMIALTTSSLTILGIGWSISLVIDNVFVKNNINLLHTTVTISIVIITILAVAIFFRYYFITLIGEKISIDIKHDLFKKILTLSPSFFDQYRKGDILSRILTDTEIIKSVISSSSSIFLRNTILLIGSIAFMLFTSSKLTFYILFSIPIIITPIIFFGKKVRNLSRKAQDQNAKISSYIEDSLFGIKTLQAYSYEKQTFKEFQLLMNNFFIISQNRIMQRALLTAIIIIFVFSSISIVLWIGGISILNNTISTGELSSFLFFSLLTATATGAMVEVFGDIQRAAGSCERICELINEKDLSHHLLSSNIIDNSNALDNVIINNSTIKTNEFLKQSLGKIEFKNVSFAYPNDQNKQILNNLSFTIDVGEKIALVGKSGAGKSTIFDLLLRFYNTDKGSILLDGVDISTISIEKYRNLFSFIEQDSIIFSTTAKNNLLIGKHNANLSQIVDACKLAYAHNFIIKLNNGYNSDLGEKGVKLSAGEKQRIALARALIRESKILLLDEATSNLDNKNEKLIQSSIEKIHKNKTIFIITHRLSTITNVDKIIYLEEGKIVESGTHAELISQNQQYAKLYNISKEAHCNELIYSK